MKLHPTAIVDPAANLADGVEVQAFSIIGPHVTIGPNTVVGPHCVIEGRTTIGANNQFYSGSQVGVRSQDLKHNDAFIGRTEIGDGNCLREHVSISASTITSEEDDPRATTIGDNCLFMACSHIAHDCHVGSDVIIANSSALGGHVHVEDKAIIGGLTGVHQFCMIGTLAMVGGMSRIWNDVPPYMIVDGHPARCGGLNTIGLRRSGFSVEARKRVKEIYKIMFRSDMNVTQALHEVESQVEDSPERAHFVEFVRKSIRGITRG